MSFPMEQLGYNLKNKLWTGMALVKNPDMVRDIHKGYIDAGADYISTSTYQISYDRLKNMGYKIFEKENDIFFKYNPRKNFKKTEKKVIKENPFGVLKNLNLG